MTARKIWKVRWRLIRIARRETRKAWKDLVLFGTSAVFVNEHGEARHIPTPQLVNSDLTNPRILVSHRAP